MEQEMTGTSKPITPSTSKSAEPNDKDVAMPDAPDAAGVPTDASIHDLSTQAQAGVLLGEDEDDEIEDHCSICLNTFQDRAVLPTCAHDFCFECIVIWTEQSRKCPLCARNMGEHIVHRIRGPMDFQRFFLPPLRSSPLPARPSDQLNNASLGSGNNTWRRRGNQARARIEREWGRRDDMQRELDELDRAVEKRRWVYHHGLYAKHVASNTHTRFRPYPTPSQFSSSDELQKRATAWLRRELRVFPGLEIEWLTQFVLSLMSSLDIRSEGAVKLLAEFLDMDRPSWENANHFAHELYSYMRSPYRDLFVYDSVVQYDVPAGISPPYVPPTRSSNWRPHSRSQSRSRSRSRSFSPERRPYQDGHPKTRSHHSGARAPTSQYHSHPSRSRQEYSGDDDMEPHQSPRDLYSQSLQRQSPASSRSSSHDRYKHERGHRKHRTGGHENSTRVYERRQSRSRSRDRIDSKGKGKARAEPLSPRVVSPSSSYQERSRSRRRSTSPSRKSTSKSPFSTRELLQEIPQSSGIRIHGVANVEASIPDASAVGLRAPPSLTTTSPLVLRIRGAAQASASLPTPPPLTPSEGASTPLSDEPSLLASSRSRQAGLPRSLKSSITAHLSATAVGITPPPRKRLENRISGADAAVLHETRARVADRRGEAVAGIQPHQTPLEAPEDEETPSRTSIGVNEGGSAAGEVAGKEVNGLRQALLDRLERERLAASTAAKPSDTPHEESKSNGSAKKNKKQDSGLAAEKDEETRLRQQAHLRARLARAQQGAGTLVDSASPESGFAGDLNGEQDGNEHGVDLDAVEQEAKLRLKLSRARRLKA